MGKRIEKAFGRDKQSSATQDGHDDDPNKTPEPYTCTGHFHTDFQELCRRNAMVVIPPVVCRPKRPLSPVPQAAPEEKTAKGGKGADKKNQPPPEPEPEPVILDENGEPPEPPPKTYTTRDTFEYFKPCVQVEMDNVEKQDTATELYVRGWKIDEPMMTVFKQCWPKMDRLNSITLWSTGLDEETIPILATILPDITNLKTLVLDNNPVKAETWHLLIKGESPVQNLSLRYNGITDLGAELLGKALGTTSQQNQKLLSLNLNGNKITDTGAEHLARGLRMNRTLLTLGLAQNLVGDPGAKKLAEVISRFSLTHEEVVERRKLLSAVDRKSVSPPPGGKRSDSRDRPGSVRSSHAGQAKGKSAKAKKDQKGGKEEDKHEKTKTKGAKDDKPQKKASVVADTKAGKKGHEKGGKGGKKPIQPQESEVLDSSDVPNPLMDMVEHLKDGIILLKGNFNLISLNLSKNKLTEEGLKALQVAVGYQSSISDIKGHKPGQSGLMRLCVQKNLVSSASETYLKLNELMVTKDPFYKAPPKTPDQESHKE